MISKSNKIILSSILIFSIVTLFSAYLIEYMLGHKPCNLCLIERYPYLGAIILISIIFILNKFEKLIFYIILLLFIFGTIVSFYHVGIEQGFFSESFMCDILNTDSNLSKESLLKQLQATTPVSCKQVTFRLLGLSLASINTIISIILSGIMIRLIKNYDKN